VLIYATMHDAVAAQAEHFGFVSLGTVPHLFDCQSAHVAWLDREQFETAMLAYQALGERVADLTHGVCDG
jgi:hypothetical protein